MIRAISHGEVDFRKTDELEEKGVIVLTLTIRREEEDRFVEELNSVIDKYSI